jgi:SsrA-binding protein
MHKHEIYRMESKAQVKGYTIVPLRVYFKGSLVKVEIGLAKGKKLYDKRQDIAKKDQKREAQRELKMQLR